MVFEHFKNFLIELLSYVENGFEDYDEKVSNPTRLREQVATPNVSKSRKLI